MTRLPTPSDFAHAALALGVMWLLFTLAAVL